MTREITLHQTHKALERQGLSLPAAITRAGEHAQRKFVEFFLAQVTTENTRKAYARAVYQFFAWCEERGVELEQVEPIRAAAYVRTHHGAPASVKQHLAALRSLYDWFVREQVVLFNPFSSVRGPRLVVREGSTPGLDAEEVRALFAAIETDTIKGLRDRALLAAMLYTFGRVSAVTRMKVKDYAPAGTRGMVLRLHEKGGKRHKVPAHHKLQEYLDAYLEAAGIAEEKEQPLFRAIDRYRQLSARPLLRHNVWEVVRRRAEEAGIKKEISPHSFRVTGITAFLENEGSLEAAQRIAAHADPRTTKIYDRRGERIDQGEIERIRFDG